MIEGNSLYKFGALSSTPSSIVLRPAPITLGRCRRLDGWEDRMAAVLHAARRRPYRLGEHDCFSLACEMVEALVGVDLWAPWAGSYSTLSEARSRIADFGNYRRARGQRWSLDELVTSAASRLFGSEPVPMALGRRGDICEFVVERPHLGIIIGASAMMLGPEGLVAVPREAGRHCWRIG